MTLAYTTSLVKHVQGELWAHLYWKADNTNLLNYAQSIDQKIVLS